MMDHPDAVYRFFDEERYADALTEGKVFVSTLARCRTYENHLQGDKDEATVSYNTGNIFGRGNDADIKKMAKNAGIKIEGNIECVHISNAISKTRIFDAFLLCTTVEPYADGFEENIGKHCVKIESPLTFMHHVTIAIQKTHRIKQGLAGKVKYRERHYSGMDAHPGRIGFVKPPDPYAVQQEYRMLWEPYNMEGLEGFVINCPEITKLCQRIL
ncbi:MAG: hypothetical protein ACTID3_08715 [Halomonas sp.]|uniref:hypothetical protein n=1 Tax=Halomonas sp. TaxID=1486246 RepID=UPI003F8F9378